MNCFGCGFLATMGIVVIILSWFLCRRNCLLYYSSIIESYCLASTRLLLACRQFSSRSICSCSKAVYKPVWHIPLPSVQWINFWWWTDELSETCRVSWQNKSVKLVHLVGFITNKFVTMHGHTSVKEVTYLL